MNETAVTAPAQDPKREIIRHTLATLAYRGGKAIGGVPEQFADFRAATDTRTPRRILAHIGDLLDWALSQIQGRQKWREAEPLPWAREVDRFFAALEALDAYVASSAPLQVAPEKLFQGAIADALTHIGQITILRRMAGCPVRGENYFEAGIASGRVGRHQAAPVREFD